MSVHFRLITSGRPKVRRTVVVDSLVEHLTVDFGRNYSRVAFSAEPFLSRSQGLILLFWALLEVKAGFRVIPTELFENRPSISVKTAEM